MTGSDKHNESSLSKDKLELVCEWSNCSNSYFNDMSAFLAHLNEHTVQRVDNLDLEYIVCEWNDCKEEFFLGKFKEFNLHLSYHGYHSKLMSIGSNAIKKISKQLNKNVHCFIDSSARTILPVLPETFVCGWKECFTEYIDAESFYRHVERHPFEDINIPLMSKEQLKKTKFAKCLWNDCTVSATSRTHLKDHLRSHTQEKLVACPTCGSMFCSKLKFSDHILRQSLNGNFTKEQLQTVLLHVSVPNEQQQVTLTLIPQIQSKQDLILDATENTNTDLKNSTLFSSTLGNFKCKFCEKILTTKSLLREHSKIHFDEYQHQCDICSFKSWSPSGILHHKKYRHSNERPFLCQFCDAKFKSKSDLRKHIDTHSNDYPFKCSICSYKCRCCHTLARHQKTVHEKASLIYSCHLCESKFTRGNNLTRHLTTLHSLSVPEGKSRFNYKRDSEGVFRISI